MILTSEQIQEFYKLITTCLIGDMESFIIENGQIRAASTNEKCFILSKTAIPTFPMPMGVVEIGKLKARLDLFLNSEGLVVNVKESERGEISMIEFSKPRMKTQYRCTSTKLIHAPREIITNDLYGIVFSEGELNELSNAVRVMGAKYIKLSVKRSGEVIFHAKDATNVSLDMQLQENSVLLAEENGDSVSYDYPAQQLLSLLKNMTKDEPLVLTEEGALIINVLGHNMWLIPDVDLVE